MNEIRAMRNINHNLFDVPVWRPTPLRSTTPTWPNSSARLRRTCSRRAVTTTGAALNEAYNLTLLAASDLMKGAGSSVFVRTHLMVTARLVELEAALLAAEAKKAGE